MKKELFEKNRAILDAIKAKYPNRVKRVGEPLGDPILSPETYPFIFLADRDPTGTEPDIYSGYAGLILIWENQTTGDFFISPDNTASPFVWNKIVDDTNINSILYEAKGTATLTLGAATVSCPSILSGDQVQLIYQTPGGTPGAIFVSSVTAGTGFTVHSTSLLDASAFAWKVLN